jgi:Ca2+-binding EF-hand superfamily protein
MAAPKEKSWEEVQKKTFFNWVNGHLRKKGLKIENLVTDFSDGIKLIKLLEVISNENIKMPNKKPTIRIMKVENVNAALKFVKEHNVNLVGIGAEEVVDANGKMILGMIWTIILRFAISDISVEELSAKEGLLLWCQRKTEGYRNVKVDNFTYSFQDGLALCALIHKHRPDLIDFDSLDKNNRIANLALAIRTAEEKLDIPKLFDPEDIADAAKPDERSILTYVASYFHAFTSSLKGEVAGRRIGKLVSLARQIDQLKDEYTARARALMEWIKAKDVYFVDLSFDRSSDTVIQQVNEFQVYRKTEKKPKRSEKFDLETIYATLITKLRVNRRPAWTPPEGLTIEDVNNAWNGLMADEKARAALLHDEYVEKVKQFFSYIDQQKARVVAVNGTTQQQLDELYVILTDITNYKPQHDDLVRVANVFEDSTVLDFRDVDYTSDIISAQYEALQTLIKKKINLLDQQLMQEKGSSISTEQLAEFRKSFDHFDKDQNGYLEKHELKACLSSLDQELSDEEFDAIFTSLDKLGQGNVTFENFSNYLVKKLADQDSPDQVKEAFRLVAGSKDFVTENDLASVLQPDDIKYLTQTMTRNEFGLDYQAFISKTYGV